MVYLESEPSQTALAVITDPVFAPCKWESLARLNRFVSVHRYEPDESIYKEFEPADALFIVMQGKVSLRVEERVLLELERGHRFGEETGTHVPHYLTDAVATTPVTILSIPKSPGLDDLITRNPKVTEELYFSLLTHIGDQKVVQ